MRLVVSLSVALCLGLAVQVSLGSAEELNPDGAVVVAQGDVPAADELGDTPKTTTKKETEKTKKKAKTKKAKKKAKAKKKPKHDEVRKKVVGEEVKPKDGFAAPYSYDNLGRGFDGADCTHQGLDIGGVGESAGVGTPVHAIVKAEVIFIGTPETNPKKFGKRDKRKGTETRSGVKVPRRLEVEGYGEVYPFTTSNGSSRTGVFIKTRVLEGELAEHSVRYMHLSAVRPGLAVGDIVEPGDELGLMGATGFEDNLPHLHIDIEDPDELRVDPAPFLGLQEVRPSSCTPINKKKKAKERKLKKGKGKKGGKTKKDGSRKTIRYTVEKGDTLNSIAQEFGVTKADLIRRNDLADPDSLKAGQKVKIVVYE